MHRRWIWAIVAAACGLGCSDAADDSASAPSGQGGTSSAASGTNGASAAEGPATSTGATSSGPTGPSGSGGASVGAGGGTGSGGAPEACPSPLPADWIFCDDFETDALGSYFEYDDNGGDFVRVDDEAASGTHSMRVVWQAGEVGAGGLSVIFGENPIGTGTQPGAHFEEIWWRMRVKHQGGWTGSPGKLSRAIAFSGSDWSEAMIAHVWSSGDQLIGDPASCVEGGVVTCQGYNDFAHLQWLGIMDGQTPIFATSDAGKWRCVEAHARMNTPGSADGVFEFWIDGVPESARTDLDWRGTWDEYGLNAVFFENYWNEGSPAPQMRWFDDLAIATVPLGCSG